MTAGPETTIVIRADSGFCRDDLMTWCEADDVEYVLGFAGNSRLHRRIAAEMRTARTRAKRTGRAARVSTDFEYRTRKSWSVRRRVIGKAEWTNGEANPRFIVTNVHAAHGPARFHYEDVYCQRGEMEIRTYDSQIRNLIAYAGSRVLPEPLRRRRSTLGRARKEPEPICHCSIMI